MAIKKDVVMEFLEKIVSTLSGIVWGPPMLILLVGTGIYLTIILKGMQFWALPHALKLIFHSFSAYVK